MMLAIGAAAASFLTIFAAAAGGSDGGTCRKLDARYQANVSTAADALRAYQACVGTKPGTHACSAEFWEFGTAQETLQAAFSSYTKACGSALASSEPTHPAEARNSVSHPG